MKTLLATIAILVFFAAARLSAQNGAWSTHSPMPVPVQETNSCALNGKIYIPGGFDSLGHLQHTLQIYNVATDSWSLGAPVPLTVHHDGIATVNGKIYIVGGYFDTSYTPGNFVLAYDTATNSWSQPDTIPVARGAHVAIAYQGKIYLFGGIDPINNASPRVDIYNPAAHSWSTGADLPSPLRHHVNGAALDSLLYVIGGQGQDSNLTTNYAYSPATNTWYTKAPMLTGRHAPSVGVINGKIYVAGGEGNVETWSHANEEYNPATNSWRELALMITPRSHLGGSVVNDRLYVIGGTAPPPVGRGPFNTTGVNESFSPTGTTGILPTPVAAPYQFALDQNYPNPFNPSTSIKFTLQHNQFVTLKIYNLLGQEAGTLLSGQMTAGSHRLQFDGSGLTSGIYFYRLQTGEGTITKRMVLLK